MSNLWSSSRQCLYRGSQSLRRGSSIGRILLPSSSIPLQSCSPSCQTPRHLLTLAIETSCDDTCVAILEKNSSGITRLYFNEKITSDSRATRGVHPLVAVASHTEHLAPLIQKALRALPKAAENQATREDGTKELLSVEGCLRLRPDFVSVTRGPGMPTNIAAGLNLAKGLAVGWDVPLLAVNHMQAHALTPRLVSALQDTEDGQRQEATSHEPGHQGQYHPRFPFLSLLVSGGHTILVHSQSLNDHAILAGARNIAIGDMLDKCARAILPAEMLSAEDSPSGMYGPMLEEFAFPGFSESVSFDYEYTPPAHRRDEIKIFDSGSGWTLTPPMAEMGKGPVAASTYEFAGLNGQVQKVIQAHPEMDMDGRRALARAAMILSFEHLTSRIMFALQADSDKIESEAHAKMEEPGNKRIKTLVLSGGVASNKFLRHVVRKILDVRGYADVELVAPPVSLCTDNAAMIAWTAMEMYEAGWRSDLGVLAMRKWPLDPNAEGGGILGASGWYKA